MGGQNNPLGVALKAQQTPELERPQQAAPQFRKDGEQAALGAPGEGCQRALKDEQAGAQGLQAGKKCKERCGQDNGPTTSSSKRFHFSGIWDFSPRAGWEECVDQLLGRP